MHRGSAPVSNARVRITGLDNLTAQEVFPAVAGATGYIVVNDIHWHGTTANTITFRSIDDGTTYFEVDAAANTTRFCTTPIAFPASKGLEVLAGDANGSTVVVFYWQPGAYGLGV